MFTFKKRYFVLTLLLFVVEVLIALYVNDRIIRPYGGDFLVVILIYFFLKTFWNQKSLTIAIVTLLFSYCVEIGQHFKLVDLLGLGENYLARIVIGTGFSWWDMLAYTLGVITVYCLDQKGVFGKEAND